jgi:hypothetical protein
LSVTHAPLERQLDFIKTASMAKRQVHPPLQLDAGQRADLLRRAYAAWFRCGGTDIPQEISGVKTRLGLTYVVLHGATGVLTVYRVRPDNMALRVLKRWPAILES